MILLKFLFYLLFLPLWVMQRIIKRDKSIWIFGAWYGKKYSDNSKYFFEYVYKLNSKVKVYWLTKSNDVYKKLKQENKPVYKANSLKGIYLSLRAGYCFLTSGTVDINKFFINGCKQVWLWHGMPLKKILNAVDYMKPQKLIKDRIYKFLTPFNQFNPNLALSSSLFFNKFIQISFNIPEDRVLKIGLPRCDVFFQESTDILIDSLKRKYSDPKIVLYMPTFRMSDIDKGDFFNPFISDYGFDEDQFKTFLDINNIVFIYKPHFVDQGVSFNISTERFLLLDDSMIKDLYIFISKIDVLLTDYSSIYFDFLCTRKRIFLVPFDYDEYLIKSRAHFFNMFEEMSAVVCSKWDVFFHLYCINIERSYDQNDIAKFSEYNKGTTCESLYNAINEMEY